ncbi:MAG: PEP-CTERM sorting domain-containing protein [Azonexaceae bacterium]|nr:PEP-CTERM sorting domain-containing protein [Azonexaceae bacterium]
MRIRQVFAAFLVTGGLLSSLAQASPVTLSFSGVVAWANDSTGGGISYSDAAVGTTATGFLTFDSAFFDTTNAADNLYGHTTTYGQRVYYGPSSIPGASQPSPLPIAAGAVVGGSSLTTVPNDYYTTFFGSVTRANPANANIENDAGVRIDQAYGQRNNGMGPDFQYVWLFTYDQNGSSTGIFDFATFLSNPVINWNSPGATTGANIRFSENQEYHLTDVQVTLVSAVPEPETYVMLLTGLGLMSLLVRRRKK